MVRGWEFIISGFWVYTHPFITYSKILFYDYKWNSRGWEFLISGLRVLAYSSITSVKNILSKKTLLCYCM